MSTWSLPVLLANLHDDIQQRLDTARKAFGHPGTKGDASESVWLELLQKYLPLRYRAEKAHIVDSQGAFSDQIDVVVFDRQYSPLIFNYANQLIIPAESVYAVFEAKQAINATQVDYAQHKVASVRKLYRTSLPIPSASGVLGPKELPYIIGGILAFESDWNPPLGQALTQALEKNPDGRLEIGCVAAHGTFTCDRGGCLVVTPEGKPATAFLLELVARLQTSGTVPMIDTRAYARWLA